MSVYVVENAEQWIHPEYAIIRETGVKAEIVANANPFEKISDAIVLSGGAPPAGSQEKLGNDNEYLEKDEIEYTEYREKIFKNFIGLI